VLKAKRAGRWYWLITKHATSRMDVLTISLGGTAEALAVFSFEEEAKMFLDLRRCESEEGWRVRQTSVGELVSVLYGPCSDAKKVALDPMPVVVREEPVGLPTMQRNDFLRFLLGEETPSNLHLVPSLARTPQKRVEHGHVA
jgi:hypothetical protein